jgi:coronin-1B/1C/6
MCFLPRRALSVSDCEIARAYKIAGSYIEPIAFIVPRKVRPDIAVCKREVS